MRKNLKRTRQQTPEARSEEEIAELLADKKRQVMKISEYTGKLVTLWRVVFTIIMFLIITYLFEKIDRVMLSEVSIAVLLAILIKTVFSHKQHMALKKKKNNYMRITIWNSAAGILFLAGFLAMSTLLEGALALKVIVLYIGIFLLATAIQRAMFQGIFNVKFEKDYR